jgi:hypothetical protein
MIELPLPPISSPKNKPVIKENKKVNEFVIGTASDISR